jgi:hypothetical protein
MPSVLFEERRALSPMSRNLLWFGAVATIAITVWQVLDRRPAFDLVLAPAVAVWLPLAIVLFIQHTRFGPDDRDLRVDTCGLRVRRDVIPATRVGRVELVHRPEALFSAYRLQVRGVPIGRTQLTYIPWFTAKPAVLVEDLGGGERPGWLLESRDPEGLVRALEQVRGSR